MVESETAAAAAPAAPKPTALPSKRPDSPAPDTSSAAATSAASIMPPPPAAPNSYMQHMQQQLLNLQAEKTYEEEMVRQRQQARQAEIAKLEFQIRAQLPPQ